MPIPELAEPKRTSPVAPAPIGGSSLLQSVDSNARSLRAGVEAPRSALLDSVGQDAEALRQYEDKKRRAMYGIPVSDEEYAHISSALAMSDNPDEERWNWASAKMYSQRLGIPMESARANLEAISKSWLQSPNITNGKSHFEAIADSFRIGDLTMDAANLARQWKDSGGQDQDLEKKIDAIYGEMANMQDRWPRGIIPTALKFGAESAPFMTQVMGKAAMAGGAAAAAVATGTAAMGGTAATFGLAAPVGAMAMASALTSAAAATGSFMASMQIMEALDYYDMRKKGVSHEIAAPLATISGGIQAIIESSLGNVPGLLGKVGGEAITGISGGIAKRLLISGKTGALGTALMGYAGEVFEEGAEEAFQAIASDVIKNVAYGLEDKGIEKMDAESIGKDVWENFKGGALASLGYGLPGAFIGYKGAARQSAALKEYAGMTDRETFIEQAGKWADVESVPEKQRNAALGQIWEQAQQKAKETREATPEGEAKPFKRTESGDLYTEETTIDSAEEGKVEAILKVGDAETKERLGYLRYEITDDGIVLSDAHFPKGRGSIRDEAILDLAAKYPGLPITADSGASEATRAAVERLTAANPKGTGANWYAEGEDQNVAQARSKLRLAISDKMPNVSPVQREAAILMHEFRANAMGVKFDEYLKNEFSSEIIGTGMDRVSAAQGQRAGILFTKGGQELKIGEFVRDAKALVMVTEKSDFVSFVHESGHMFRKQLIGTDLGKQLDEAYQIVGGTWTREHEERFVDDLVKYLSYGEVKDEKLKGVFSKIAEWITRLWDKVLNQADVDPRIRAVMDELFKSDVSPLQEAASTSAIASDVEVSDRASALEQGGKDEVLFQQADPVDSEAFRKWFGDSKVVDNEGKPLVMYHGGEGLVDNFIKGAMRGGEIGVAFFTSLKEVAESYANTGMPPDHEGEILERKGSITEVYLKIERPVPTTAREYFSGRKIKDVLEFVRSDIGDEDLYCLTDAVDEKDVDGFYESLEQAKLNAGAWSNASESLEEYPFLQYIANLMAGSSYFKETINKKYDGFIFDDAENGGTTYVPFSAMQIKSINNQGTWNSEDPRILFQTYEPTKKAQEVFDAVIKHQGETDDIREAGFVLPDGRMVDLSGRIEDSDYKRVGDRYKIEGQVDYLKGKRMQAHSDVRWEGSPQGARGYLVRQGAVRIDAKFGIIELDNEPTSEQVNVLSSLYNGNEVAIEAHDKGRSADIRGDDHKKAMGLLRRFYDGEDVGNVLFQYVGEKANLDETERQNLSIAKEMAQSEKDSETIRLATGWFKGKYDGKWRLETTQNFTLKMTAEDLTSRLVPLEEAIDYPELFTKYPAIGNTRLFITDTIDHREGSYEPGAESFYPEGLIKLGAKGGAIKWENLTHELQHAVQDIEDFARGGSIRSDGLRYNYSKGQAGIISTRLKEIEAQFETVPYASEEYRKIDDEYNTLVSHREHVARFEAYERIAGEIEARDVASRMGLSPEQRQAIPPYSSENIDANDAVVLFQIEPTEEEQVAFDSALDTMGQTFDVSEAGYVLPSGELLDMSGRFEADYTKNGRKWKPNRGKDFLKGQRSVDHRDIVYDGQPSDRYETMEQFIGYGAIRIDTNAGLADMSRLPTPKQWDIIKGIIESSGTAWLEMRDGKRTATVTIEGKPNKALGVIRRFYAGEDVSDSSTLFQLDEDAIDAEAATFDSWQEWREYVEGYAIPAFGEDTRAPEGVQGEVADGWYAARWEAAHSKAEKEKAKAREKERKEARRGEFASRMAQTGGVEKLLASIWDAEVQAFDTAQASDEQESAEIDKAYEWKKELAQRLAGHPLVLLAAQSVGNGKKLKPSTRKAILAYVRNNEIEFAALYAELTGDLDLAQYAEAGRAKLQSIPDPRLDKYADMSIAERTALLNRVSDQEVRARIKAGELSDPEFVDYVRRLEEAKKSLTKEAEDAKAEIEKLGGELENESDFAMKMYDRSKTAAKALESTQNELNKAKAAKERVEAAKSAYVEALGSARDESKLTAKIAKKEYLAALNEARKEAAFQSRFVAAEIRATTKLRAQRDALRRYIMKKPSKNIIWEKKQQIKTIQEYLRSKKWEYIEEQDETGKIKRRRSYDIVTDENGKSHKVPRYTTVQAENLKAALSMLLRESPGLGKMLTQDLVDRINDKPVTAWTVSELQDLREIIDRLTKEGREEYDIKKMMESREAKSDRYDIEHIIRKNKRYKDPAAHGSDEERAIKKKMEGFATWELPAMKMRYFAPLLDGGIEGVNTKLLVHDEYQARREQQAQKVRRLGKVQARMREMNMTQKERQRKITIAGIGPGTTDVTMSAARLSHVALLIRNDKGRAAYIYGNLFSENERTTMPREFLQANGDAKYQKLIKAIDSNLTDGEKEIIDLVAAGFGGAEFDRMNKAVIELTNEEMKPEENYSPLYREGAYFDSQKDSIIDSMKAQHGFVVNPESGFTIARIKIAPEHQSPVRVMDIVSMFEDAVDTQEHLIAYGAYVKKLHAVYQSQQLSKGVREGIIQTYGKDGMEYVDKYIGAVSQPDSSPQVPGDKMLRKLRGYQAVGFLAYRWTSVVKQLITSPLPYMAYAPKETLASAFQAMGSGNMFKFIEQVEAKSGMLQSRTIDQIFEAIKTMDSEGWEGLVKQIGTVGMKGLEFADRVSVAIGWKGVYDKELSQGATEEEAVKKADDITFQTQPSANPADLAPIYRDMNEWKRILLMFTSSLNTVYNNIRHGVPKAIREKEYGQAVGIVTSYAVAGVLLGAFAKSLGKDPPPDDPDEWWRQWVFYSMTQFTDSVPLIGNEVSGVMKRMVTKSKGTPFGEDTMPTVTAIISGFDSLNKGDIDKAAENFAEGVGLATGLPTLAIEEYAKNIGSLMEGE